MSVDLVSWMAEENIGPLHYIADPTHGATRIRVGALRGLGYQVGWDPLPGNPHHGEVWGNFNGPRRKRAIAAAAQTVKKAQGES